jgi:hypothetical protein
MAFAPRVYGGFTMVTRKKRVRVEGGGDASVLASHMAAILENIEQQNRATIEALQATEHRLMETFGRRFDAIEVRLSALEFAVRKNSEDIRKNSDDIRKNSDDIRKNSEDIAQLQQEVARIGKILGVEADENTIAVLERRVTAIETRLGMPGAS